ncbi:metallophosphoesterase family protein [Proteiniphilum sp. UBA5384]|uniref:metallophosphoesterase family protein n=1 Tax=Proteiniphilum sp. UBA5384 TaxID=1947279 RepID=UPI0025ECA991|nr:metallophosphoesterase [Proteiniphilum sp. UBA5384]
MHDIGVVLISLFILFAGCASSGNPEGIKIAVITDIHFLDTLLVSEGDALSAYEQATGRGINDLHEVLEKVLADLETEAPEWLLVTGDITNHGEKQSHLGFIEKLRTLQNRGTRILVIPGNHDINIPDAKAYRGDKAVPAETISKEEFAELYAQFGYADALKRDEHSLSYLAAINESVWLLCFDTNRYEEHTTSSITAGRILPATMEWALDILHEAKEKGVTVLGMMHHGLVEHMPYQSTFFSQYLIDEWQKNADLLADAGLKVVFTGHFHANDITMRTSSAGNAIYDVETASLAHYPFAYRIMTLTDDGLSIDSRFVTSIPGNPDLTEIYKDKLDSMTRRVATRRIEGLGIPMSAETLKALTDVIVKLNLMHVKGDEKPDLAMKMAIRLFADQLGSEANPESFTFDFPPEDNRVMIPLW